VLAYGPTGSGKTFTMGSSAALGSAAQLGVIPRVIQQLYEGIAARQGEAMFVVRAQFLEIHNEEVRDLLHPDIPPKVSGGRGSARGAGVPREWVPAACCSGGTSSMLLGVL
jgi:hypothetical protein